MCVCVCKTVGMTLTWTPVDVTEKSWHVGQGGEQRWDPLGQPEKLSLAVTLKLILMSFRC